MSYLADFNPQLHIFGPHLSFAYSTFRTGNGLLIPSQSVVNQVASQMKKEQVCACYGPSGGRNSSCPASWANIQDSLYTSLQKLVKEGNFKKLKSSQASRFTAALNNPLAVHNLQDALHHVCAGGSPKTPGVPIQKGVFALIRESTANRLLRVPTDDADIDHMGPQRGDSQSETLSELLYRAASHYYETRNKYNDSISETIATNNKLSEQIQSQQRTIDALQKKVSLAYQVLNAEGTQLQTLTKDYSNYQAQDQQRSQDRVGIGFPFFDPIVRMSQRNYVLLMVALTVVVVVIIFVYGFTKRKSFAKVVGSAAPVAEPVAGPVTEMGSAASSRTTSSRRPSAPADNYAGTSMPSEQDTSMMF